MYPANNEPTIAVVDQEAIARARYFAYVQRRAMPPRCSPISILVIVLALGMMFIGLTMTIIANWPGATTIGENPLKIAGPVLLALGLVLFILGIIMACVLNNLERTKWEQNITNLVVQKSNTTSTQPLVNSFPPGPPSEPAPGYKSNLRGTKTSGEESARDSESVPGYYSGGSNKGYPDPNYRAAIPSNGRHAEIPDPIRIQKVRHTPQGNGNGSDSANVSSEIGAADLGGFGVYSPSAKRPSPDVHNTSQNSYHNPGYVYSERQQRGTAEEEERGQGGNKRRQQEGGSGNPTTGSGLVASQFGVPRSGLDQQHLRVHIKAQPGTAVHITPAATPPRMTPLNTPVRGTRGHQTSRPVLAHDDSSAETEI